MKIYLVGGAVRDQLLGREVKDRDYVVVGGTPDDLKAKGYVSVGRHFPVFIDPETKNEYALARKEKKVSTGHDGFEFDFGPEIELIEDLLRRDFTVNAMALDKNIIIDPYGGQKDIENKILRHVSKHFIEDPLRVIRGLRFSSILNFSIASETIDLMKKMVESKELESLSSERIWMELKIVLEKGNIKSFFSYADEIGVTELIFPGLNTKKINWNSFKDTDWETKFCLLQSFSTNRDVYFKKYIVPKKLKKKALLLVDFEKPLIKCFDNDPQLILDFMNRVRLDVFTVEELLRQIVLLYPDFKFSTPILELLNILKAIDLSQITSPKEIHTQQLELIKSYLLDFKAPKKAP